MLMCQYDNMPIEEKLQLIVCGTVELCNCGIVELLNCGIVEHGCAYACA